MCEICSKLAHCSGVFIVHFVQAANAHHDATDFEFHEMLRNKNLSFSKNYRFEKLSLCSRGNL